MLGGTQRFVETETDGSLDPAAVRDVVGEDTACIIVNTPNNPTGAVYDEATMTELVAIAEENDAILVSDEVYDHFDFSGEFTSALEFDSEHRIVTNSFSKSLAMTGFRVGYTIAHEQHTEPMKSRHMLTNVTSSRPHRPPSCTRSGETDPDYYRESRDLLRERVATFTDALDDAGAEYTTPDGAFYVLARFPDFPGAWRTRSNSSTRRASRDARFGVRVNPRRLAPLRARLPARRGSRRPTRGLLRLSAGRRRPAPG